MSSRLTGRLRSKRSGVGKVLLAIIIVITAVISSTFTYAFVSLSKNPVTGAIDDSGLVSSIADMFPVGTSNNSTTGSANVTTTSCYTGNWSSIYSEYETLPADQQNASALGQQYLNNSQFMSFLSQYLNLNDPQVNATVRGLLSGNETMFIEQQLQSQGLSC